MKKIWLELLGMNNQQIGIYPSQSRSTKLIRNYLGVPIMADNKK